MASYREPPSSRQVFQSCQSYIKGEVVNHHHSNQKPTSTFQVHSNHNNKIHQVWIWGEEDKREETHPARRMSDEEDEDETISLRPKRPDAAPSEWGVDLGAMALGGDGKKDSKMNLEEHEEHPLNCEWTLWFDKKSVSTPVGVNKKNPGTWWEANLREVCRVQTVEFFWRYLHNIQSPSQMELNSNYHFFKSGIKPMWEDAANAAGGKWVVRLQGRDRQASNTIWINVLMALVGEILDTDNVICGVVLSKRRSADRVALWTKAISSKSAIVALGKNLRSMMLQSTRINGAGLVFTYEKHKSTGSGSKHKVTLPPPEDSENLPEENDAE
eukprot:g71789.t1